ncbi:hypothetical protein JW926_14470 [Candidatus Sumerlaeota bacterium]|nr:hypothetical protein [Candidatus Sumerlaeota bacterium]
MRFGFFPPIFFILFLSFAWGNTRLLTNETTPTVHLDISPFPVQVDPNVDFDVTIEYEMDLYEYGLKSRIFLEIRNLSDHGVIFDGWIRDGEGNKTKIRYWSSQSSANGIGFREENYSNLNLETTRFARVIKPVDDDDWDNRYADANTLSHPTRVGALASVSSWLLY